MQKGVSPTQHQIESLRDEKSDMRRLGQHRAIREQLPKHLIVRATFKELLPFILIAIGSIILAQLIF